MASSDDTPTLHYLHDQAVKGRSDSSYEAVAVDLHCQWGSQASRAIWVPRAI